MDSRLPVPENHTSAQSTTGLRRLLPAIGSAGPSGEAVTTATEPLPKHTRRQVPAACLNCRRRKLKCSGSRPVCRRCSAQKLECEWDTDPDTPRVVSIRRRKEELERENENLHEFLRFLSSRPEEEAVEIFKRLRASGDPLQVLDHVRSGDLLLQKRVVDNGASPSNPPLGGAEVDDLPGSLLEVPARPWTALANDGVVSELITSFFVWDEPFFLAFVDREAFLADMRDCSPETAAYCSPVLVNAICALRSHTSRRAKAFGHVNGCDMPQVFLDEAKRQLELECGRVSLATAQALFVMHLSAAALGIDRAARMYQLAACDMITRWPWSGNSNECDGERERIIMSKALWGTYCFESIFAFVYLRPSLLPTPSIPRVFVHQNPRKESPLNRNDHRTAIILNATCDLSIIYNKAMDYNRRLAVAEVGSEQDIQKRVAFFAELRAWRDTIPRELQAEASDAPAYYLRAYEDVVVLGIFRPLEPNLRLPKNGFVGDLLLAYCERSIGGIEEHERALSLRECSSMVLSLLFNVSITLARLLPQTKTHELFSRTCRLIRDRADDFPFARFLLQGLLAIAEDGGDQIPQVAKTWFEGLQIDESMLRDVPISFVVPSRGDMRGGSDHGDSGQLGSLISRWSGQSVSDSE